MAAGLENVAEESWMRVARSSGGHTSIELNAQCPFESACGNNCFLIARNAPRSALLSTAAVRSAFQEILDAGEQVRHFGVVGMEPMATPDRLFQLLEMYHAKPARERPLTFNIITSGYALERYTDRFVELPLWGLIVSVDDAPSTGLRVVGSGKSALAKGVHLREAGGCQRLAVNTVLTRDNVESVLRIGRSLADAGVDQWLVGFMTRPSQGQMRPEVSDDELVAVAHRVADELSGRGMKTMVHLDAWWNLAAVPGGAQALVDQIEDWRLAVPIAGDVELIAWNPDARFLRVRWDGAIMNHREFVRTDLHETAAGRYNVGSIKRVIESWQHRNTLAFQESM